MKQTLIALLLAVSSSAMAQQLAELTTTLVGVDNKTVSLRWNNPETINGLFDDFESHTDFTINSAGTIGWQYIDADNANTYTWTAADFPGQGKPMAFIVFNPSKTSPSTAEWPDIKPYSGKKLLIDFTVDGGNNDYLISPALNFDEDFQFSFRARSYTESYGKERYRVGYSTTGMRPSDFKFIQGGSYAEVPAAWTLCKYTIPKEAKYVCLNCVSQEAFMFMVDDIFIGTNIVRPQAPAATKLQGFNLLRNGEQVNTDFIDETTYTDIVPDYGTYTYTVQSVMTDGSTNVESEPLEVEVPDIRYLPFEDDFDASTIDTTKWSMPVDEAGNENKWCRDYYSYGLVDYSACYPYSYIGKNYSQSLVSRELRTQDAANTSLRFQVRLDNNPKYTGSYLSAEVSADDGQTWTSLVDIPNDEGTFAWRTYEYQLSDALNGAEFFKIRFRAHGLNPWEINYWFVDDVKVWCPQTRQAQVNVVCGGQPLAGASVSLTADHGAVYTGTTDSQGVFSLQRMEVGTYDMTIESAGCNAIDTVWTLTADGSATYNATMLRPIVSWSESNISLSVPQETETERTVTLTNSGDGPVYWYLDPQPEAQTGTTEHRFTPGQSFDASGDLQSSVAFDGEYFYTASSYTLGRFYKYDRNGNFLEEFTVPGMYYKLYDFAYDGTYIYASDLSKTIFQLDLRNKKLIRQFDVKGLSSLTITHLTYDPQSDELWFGDWTRLGRVDREGNVTVELFSIGGSSDDVAVMGSALDNVSEGGPYLWFSNLAHSGNNSIDNIQLLQYDLNNRKLTGVEHTTTDVDGYKVGSSETPVNGGGVELTTQLVAGQLTLIGIMQQSPSRIYTYRMADFDQWYSAQPLSGTLQAGETAEVKLTFDTRHFALNETDSTTLKFGSSPALTSVADLTLSLTANSMSAQPRPVNLAATVDDSAANVTLAWQAAENSSPVAYSVLRDSVEIATTTDTTYTDSHLVRGSYAYSVRALYGAQQTPSAMTDTVCVTVKTGAPFFAPLDLKASISNNKNVTLTWLKPDSKLRENATLRWDNGQNDGAVGVSGGGYFYAGVAFDADDLEAYRGMTISSVDVFLKERMQSMTLKVYKDGKAIVSKRVPTDSLKFGEFNTLPLDTLVSIDRGSDYRVAFLIVHESGLQPLGVNNATTVEGKSNVMSEDGKTWYPASYAGFSGMNFNIAMNLTPTAGYTETAPSAYRIMRNGSEVGSTEATQFSETLTEAGVYDYNVVSLYDADSQSSPSATASVTVEEIGTPIAPKTLKATVERNSYVSLHWDFPIADEPSVPVDLTTAGTSPEGRPELVSQFSSTFTGESGIVSDGNYIYTTRHSVAGIVNRYKMDGTFDETLGIATNLTEGFRNLAFDGENFWATANGSAIYKLDLASDEPSITDTYSISEIARHIAYVPTLDEGKGGFEVGDWETSIMVTKEGAKIGDGPTLKGAAGSAYYDGILYTFEQGYETAYELCARNFATGELLWHTPVSEWSAIVPSTGASAGGMSLLQTKEGLNLLCATLQEQTGARFMFFDLGSVKGLAGYNVFRNGEKLNTTPLSMRQFADTLNVAGDYDYQIQTEYIDGSVSELSAPQTVTIVSALAGETPTDVKAKPTAAGYNVNISVVDPTSLDADQYESFETGTVADAVGFSVTDDAAFAGTHSLKTTTETDCELIVTVDKTYDSDFAFSFVARNADDSEGAGSVQLLTSTSSTDDADFVNFAQVSTSEAWKLFSFTMPAATKYIVLRCKASYAEQFIDALTVNATAVGRAYGYDIMRGDTKLNGDTPFTGVTYTDHNLLPGTYSYKVRAYYDNAAVSDWSEPVSVTVSYDNGHQAPGQLSVEQTAEGNRLTWSTPALSDVTELRWHNGVSAGSAGMPSGGSYYAGVQFDTDDLADYASMSISEVSFYVNQVPDVLFVQLYEGSDLVYEKYVPTLKQYSMNTVTLDAPIRVNAAKSLRAVVYVEHNSITVPLGYDAGPARTGRGDLYSSDGTTWSTLTDNDIDGNWNITIGLRAYATTTSAEKVSNSKAERYVRHAKNSGEALRGYAYKEAQSAGSFFAGYNVYCNGDLLNDTPLTVDTNEYLDAASHKGHYYEYQVKTIYPDYGEVGSNVVRILATGIDSVNADNSATDSRAYTVDGKQTDAAHRGVVIQNGKKRMRK